MESAAPLPSVSPPAQTPPSKKKRTSPWLWLLAIVASPLFAVPALFALYLRANVYELFRMPSASMAPTLLVGDHFFTAKAAYRDGKLPERGDVVVFRKPGDENGDALVKRVVGLPGDRVSVRAGQLSICVRDGRCDLVQTSEVASEPRGQDGDIAEPIAARVKPMHRRHETLGPHAYDTLTDDGAPHMEGYNDGSWTVEEGHVFVVGDNRDNSADSRFAAPTGPGQVPFDHLLGRVDVIWLSLGGGRGLRTERTMLKVR